MYQKLYDPYADFVHKKLANGVSLYSTYWNRPWLALEAVVHVGSREDPVGKQGIAHFLEHCISQNIPNLEYDDAKNFFEDVGGFVNFGATSYLASYYQFFVPAEPQIIKRALEIFGSMLFRATIEKHIERERKVINREFHQHYPVRKRLEWKMEPIKILLPDHRLATYSQPIGFPEDFLAITPDELQHFYDQYYVPANVSITAVGGITPEELLVHLESSPFGMDIPGVKNKQPEPIALPQNPAIHKKQYLASEIIKGPVHTAEFSLMWTIPVDLSRQALRIYSHMLYEILDDEIRQKRGLSYGAGTHYPSYQDIRLFIIDGDFDPEFIPEIETIVRQAIDDLPNRNDLFIRKRDTALKKIAMMDLSGLQLVDDASYDLIYSGKIETLTSLKQQIDDLRIKDMAAISALLTPERQFEFLITP